MTQKRVCLTCKNTGCVLKCRYQSVEPVRPATAKKEG